MDSDIETVREKYLNQQFDETEFFVDPAKTIEYAKLCGETASRFLDPEDPDFQAPANWVTSLSGRRMLPGDFPKFGIGMDAGKGVECFEPVRPGTKLIGKSHIHDVYSKTGRSGRMIFVVMRIEFFDQNGIHVANADSRSVQREKAR